MPTDAKDKQNQTRRAPLQWNLSPTDACVKRRCTREGTNDLDLLSPPQQQQQKQQQQQLDDSNDWSDFVHPQELQKQFLERLLGGVKEEPYQVSDEVPSLPPKQPSSIPRTSSRSSLHYGDSSMFGDDIPLDFLDQLPDVTNIPPVAPAPAPAPAPAVQPPPPPIQPKSPAALPKCNLDYDDDDDMFGDDIPLDLLENVAIDGALLDNVNGSYPTTPTTNPQPDVSLSIKKDEAHTGNTKYRRYTIAFMHMKQYLEGDSQRMEKELLLVSPHHEDRPARAYLRQDWLQMNLKTGDTVNICFTEADPTSSNAWIIDNDHNYLIQHPDHLISCTAVAESFFCLRKSVLQMTTKGVSDFSEPLVHGAIIHETLQYCLQNKDFSTQTLQDTLERIILSSLDSLYVIGQDEKKAYGILETYIKSIQVFGSVYVGSEVKAAAKVEKDMGPTTSNDECTSVAIRDVLDIEEHVWSPAYGLKGMIDATVEVVLAPSQKVLTIPFELKTGKASRSVSHRAQTILYTLLLGDRYDIDIKTGVLYYSKTNSLYMVPALRSELRSLIIARNELALAFHQQSQGLPTMVKNLHSCQYCSMSNACLIHHKAIERGTAETSGLGEWFEDHTAHISDQAAAFYRHWIGLIAMEEKDLDLLRKDIWSESASKCELLGKCLQNMVVTGTRNDDSASNWYTFQRHGNHTTDAPPIMNSNLIVGDTIVVSSMQGDLLLGTGFLTHIDPDSVTISLNTPLRHPPLKEADFDLDVYQVFKKWWNQAADKDMLYRLDRDEGAGGFALMKSNLVALFTHNDAKPSPFDEIHAKLRRLIVDSKPPEFLDSNGTVDDALTDPAYAHLNSDQLSALKKVITCQDYALILGMPGTGKTTTTADLIKFLLRQGKSVLLTAYTHNALDNVLLKLVDAGVDVLRLGNPEKVMPRLHGYMPDATPDLTTVEAMSAFYDSKRVVGATCYGTNHIVFRRKRFDYCIVDEASQITLPVCVGPLQYADRFVLVGDQYQLPPIVKDKRASDAGFSVSLFATLARNHPEAIAYLEYQYRMNKDIMTISSELVYDCKLKCGNEHVASRTLSYPHLDKGLKSVHFSANYEDERACRMTSQCWLKDILDPSRSVVFVDTDGLPAKESKPGAKVIQNEQEATLVYQTAEALLQCGLTEDQVAVISVYRTQLRLIAQHFAGQRPDLEIATIDKYQGRDKDCVLISLVRSNDNGTAGHLLKDWRRLNVAFTRAKCKLIIFGSWSTLKHATLFGKFLDLFEKNQWVYRLVKDAHESHAMQLPFKVRTQVSSRSHTNKTFTNSSLLLKHRPILKDVYNYATQN